MNPAASVLPSASAMDRRLAELVDQLTNRLQRGESVDVDAFLAEHADHADALRRLLPALAVLADLRSSDEAQGSLADRPQRVEGLAGLLGDFRIVREVGRGGMGVVYEAEQISLVRRVALKILPFAGVLDPRQLQRFKNEAQAAAQLDHPNIVDVIAIGSDRGVHYYAMRFIDGLTLAQVINDLRQASGTPETASTRTHQSFGGSDDGLILESESESDEPEGDRKSIHDQGHPQTKVEKRSFAERKATNAQSEAFSANPTPPLAGLSTERGMRSREFFRSVALLMVPAAEALDHAHRVGVIHRDIKPSNLMLDARGKLWVTDFGLAHVESSTEMTLTGDLLGTLRYMSPEQALAKRGLVDHRSDVYSLGATLYELLTLSPVFGSRDRQALLRSIAFDEPTPPRRLNKSLPGELETIVLKALEKSPGDRYATAQDLADDLRRFAEDRPIHARRPGLRDRAVKWSRRHAALVAVAACSALIAVAALGVSLWRINAALDVARHSADLEKQARHAATQAAEAEKSARVAATKAANAERETRLKEEAQRKQADAVSDVLSSIFRGIGAGPDADLKLDLLQRLDDLSARLDTDFADQPALRAALAQQLGLVYSGLGETEKSVRLCEQALDHFKSNLTPRDPLILASMTDLARVYRLAGRFGDASGLAEQSLASFRAASGDQQWKVWTLVTMRELGWAYLDGGRFDDAVSLFEEALDGYREELGSNHAETLHALNHLALAYKDAGQLEKASSMLQEALAFERAKLGDGAMLTDLTAHSLALVQSAAGDFASARSLGEAVLQNRRERLGTSHPSTLNAMNSLGVATLQAGNAREAALILEEAFEKQKVLLGPAHPQTLATMSNLALPRMVLGQHKKAIELLQEALALQEQARGPEHPDTLSAMNSLASCFETSGRTQEAVRLFEEVARKQEAVLGADHPRRLTTLANLVGAYLMAGQAADALPIAEDLVRRQREKRTTSRHGAHATESLGRVYEELHQYDKALPLFQETLDARRAQLGSEHPHAVTAMINVARAYCSLEQPDKAVALFEEAYRSSERTLGADHPDTLDAQLQLAYGYRHQRQFERATALLEKSREALVRMFGADNAKAINATHCLGLVQKDLNRFDEALPLFQQAYDANCAIRGPHHPTTLQCMADLAETCRATFQAERAASLFQDLLSQWRELLGRNDERTAWVAGNLAEVLLALEKFTEAEAAAREALDGRDATAPNGFLAFYARALLGRCLLMQNKLTEAEPLLLAGYSGMAANSDASSKRTAGTEVSLADTVSFIVSLYDKLGNEREAARWIAEGVARFERALEVRMALPDRPETAATMADLGTAYLRTGRLAEALPLLEKSLDATKRILGADHQQTLTCMCRLASAYVKAGQVDQGVALSDETVERSKGIVDLRPALVIETLQSVAIVYEQARQIDKEVAIYERLVELAGRTHGPDALPTLETMNHLARAHWLTKRLDRSVPLFEELVRVASAKLGSDHDIALTATVNLAVNYHDAGRLTDAIALLEKISERVPKLQPAARDRFAWTRHALADMYDRAGESGKAEPLLHEFLQEAEQGFGPDDPRTAGQLAALGLNFLKQQKYVEAEPHLRRCLDIRAQKIPDDWLTFNTRSLLGGSLLGQQKHAEAEPLLIEGYEGMNEREAKIPPPGRPRISEALERLVQLYEAWGKPDEAEKWRQKHTSGSTAVATDGESGD